MPIQFKQSHQGIVGRRLKARRCPREHWRRPADHQRRDRPDREGFVASRAALIGDPPARFDRKERAVEPAGIGGARCGEAAFEHILTVEMRAFPVGRGDRVNDAGLTSPIEPVQIGHLRVERKKAIERECGPRSIQAKSIVAAQRYPVGVADRRHRGESIERAA